MHFTQLFVTLQRICNNGQKQQKSKTIWNTTLETLNRNGHTYRVKEDETKKKFYVLNMFPYPSGAGLHVGHPLGYIASDIYARYKRQQGYNVFSRAITC